jgi:hypothetical protein
LCVSVGLYAIIQNKYDKGKSLISTSNHSICGFGCLTIVIFQICTGLAKIFSTQGIFRWHGRIGLLVYTIGTSAMILGVKSELTSHNLWIAYFCIITSCLVLINEFFQIE